MLCHTLHAVVQCLVYIRRPSVFRCSNNVELLLATIMGLILVFARVIFNPLYIASVFTAG